MSNDLNELVNTVSKQILIEDEETLNNSGESNNSDELLFNEIVDLVVKYIDMRETLVELIDMKKKFSDILKGVNQQVISQVMPDYNDNELFHAISIDNEKVKVSIGKHDYTYTIVRYIMEALDEEIKKTNEKMNKIANKIIKWRNE